MTPSSHSVKRPMWRRLALVTVLLAVVPTGVVGIGLINVNEETLETTSRDFRLVIAEDITNTLQMTLERGTEDVTAIARILGNPGASDPIALSNARLESSAATDHAVIFGTDGKRIDAVVQEDVVLRMWPNLDEATRTAALEESVFFGEAQGNGMEVSVAVVVPILAGEKHTGFVGTDLSLGPVQERLTHIATHRLPGDQGIAYVVDKSLRLVAHPDIKRAANREKLPPNTLLENLQTGALQKQIAQSGEVPTPEGTKVASLRPMELLPWAVMVEVPVEIAYKSVRRMRLIVGAGVATSIVLAMVLALFFARRFTQPIEALVEFAQRLARRDFDARLVVGTEDEVGALTHSLNGAAQDLKESEEKLEAEIEIRNDLRRYLPDELVNQIVAREQDLELGGERREITVMFADVVRFTPLCEELEPEQVVALLNELFTILTEIVFRHGGTIDKFVGDCVMAFWGAPTPAEDHAALALEAAEDMLRFLESGNDIWETKYGVRVELAIGVHSGEAIVGNIGSETRMEYTAIGDTVNVAARLEVLARPGQILSTSVTRMVAGEGFDMAHVTSETLVAGQRPIEIYEVVL